MKHLPTWLVVLIVIAVGGLLFWLIRADEARRHECEDAGGYWMRARGGSVCLDRGAVINPRQDDQAQ